MDSDSWAWVYVLLPEWVQVIPVWAWASATLGTLACGGLLWRYMVWRQGRTQEQLYEAEDNVREAITRRVDRLSDRYSQLDTRIEQGFEALHGAILASEQRHNDRLIASMDAIRDQQHRDHIQSHQDVAKLSEGIRQEVQRFHMNLERGLIGVSKTQERHDVRIGILEDRAAKAERRLTALEGEQRAQAQAINGRRTVTDHLGEGDS
jgi:hypothetical protein